MRVLVVDDEADLRLILQINLRRWGHEPVLAASAAQAYEVIRTDPPDALLLDVSMPGESGLDLLDRLRAEGRMPPQVALLSAAFTGSADHGDGVRHLSKPFGVAELQQLVADMAADADGA